MAPEVRATMQQLGRESAECIAIYAAGGGFTVGELERAAADLMGQWEARLRGIFAADLVPQFLEVAADAFRDRLAELKQAGVAGLPPGRA